MLTTIDLDDELIAKAQAYTGLEETTELVREALKALIQREVAKQLANLGGSQPGIKGMPLYRSQASSSRRARMVEAASMVRCMPIQRVFAPGSPSLLRPRNPPSEAIRRMI